MRLSIITINYNNAEGLAKTLASVNVQSCLNFEHIIIDGASTDQSVDVIRQYESPAINRTWISESDKGIYNAMNKGIRMAKGEYVQFLNSGDTLVDKNVVEDMLRKLSESNYPPIIYGNMRKEYPSGTIICNRNLPPVSFYTFYKGTINHSSTYIKRDLFNEYGNYDENFRIVSDWKWFLNVVGLQGVSAIYINRDVTLFDMTGISETNKNLNKDERRRVLEEMIPAKILDDYDKFGFVIEQYNRLIRYPIVYRMVWLIERCLFKLEKMFPRNKC